MKHYRGPGFRVIYDVVREPAVKPGETVYSGNGAATIIRRTIEETSPSTENFYVIMLDTRHRVIGVEWVTKGILNSAPVHPREVFRPAIAIGAKAIIIAHNHPSGDVTPSTDDSEVTDRMKQVGELVGIEVLDHIIVSETHYYSFADRFAWAFPEI